MLKLFILLNLLFMTKIGLATEIKNLSLGANCNVRVVIENSKQSHTKADLLFLTGFSDRADNHSPLFESMSANGYRVISFDYPSHGETKCWSLNSHSIVSLEGLAIMVLMSFPEQRPLYVAGWSTGGLLAYRMAQRGSLNFRDTKGFILLAPGLSVYPIPGDMGFVTEQSLLSNPNPPHVGDISPTSPLLYPFFGADLIATSLLARAESVPQIPLLMILGDDKADVYANTPKIKKWFTKNKSKNFVGYHCPTAKHELDNEIEPIGSTVRALILNFLEDQTVSQNETCLAL